MREQQAMKEVTRRLTTTFADSHPPEQVTHTIDAVYHRFDERPIRDFVPILVERLTRERLTASRH
ncbi:three-helix bundle dimerization domain-containing protein [Actinomadura macrotermitis]|uniref:three-helix bundle dimerization domain-containing protein n=1 Tax=Actinomadura macrotermitis TaxID=2585200 RepID=UPI001294F6DA|nr:hypothetical protein [Actinomadura macrotermitis]